jgi:hypothetical protein
MPVDPNALVHAILNGLAKAPEALIAAALLAGPTVIWMILRFISVTGDRARYLMDAAPEEFMWVCESCRSVNHERDDRCYRCRTWRPFEGRPMLVPVVKDETDEVGIPVGPGLPVEAATTGSWLGAAVAGASRPVVEHEERETATEPAEQPASDERSVAEDVPALIRPSILEPRVRVSTRTPGPPPTGRQGRRQTRQAGDGSSKGTSGRSRS